MQRKRPARICKRHLNFKTKANENILARVPSRASALTRVEKSPADLKNWNFDAVARAARKTWTTLWT